MGSSCGPRRRLAAAESGPRPPKAQALFAATFSHDVAPLMVGPSSEFRSLIVGSWKPGSSTWTFFSLDCHSTADPNQLEVGQSFGRDSQATSKAGSASPADPPKL